MKRWLKDNRGFLIFLLCFGFFRSAMADWNPIPSGSMRPTLLEGDVVLVNRLAYDFKLPLTDVIVVPLGEPRRGDIATFSSPQDGTRLIKRLVGVPGDTIEMRDERLYVNGVPAAWSDLRDVAAEPLYELGATTPALRVAERVGDHERTVQFLPEVNALRSFGPVTVPADAYFFLGDSRDNSGDSRYFGAVPRRLLIGRAHHVLVSADFKEDWRLRFERFGQRLQ